jgi:hypothetical protein
MDLLCAPFPTVGWKPQAVKGDKALMVAYVDARDVAERFDKCVGGKWEFYWNTELATPDHVVVRGRLVVNGIAREDVGEAFAAQDGNEEPLYKAAVSDALKRCAVLFGVGRYLYRLPQVWIKWDVARRAPAQGEIDRLNSAYQRYIKNLDAAHEDEPGLDSAPEPDPEPKPKPRPAPKPAKASGEINDYWDKEQINAFFLFAKSKGISPQKALDILGVRSITMYDGTLEDAMDVISSALEG